MIKSEEEEEATFLVAFQFDFELQEVFILDVALNSPNLSGWFSGGRADGLI